MALHYGVIPQEMPPPDKITELAAWIDRFVQEKQMAAPGDRIVIVSGLSMSTPGTMNNLVIHTVGEVWSDAAKDFPRLAQ
jgi:pyruvate kinase